MCGILAKKLSLLQAVPPEAYISHGAAATREPEATRPRAIALARSSLGRENISDFRGVGSWDEQDCEGFDIFNEKLERPSTSSN